MSEETTAATGILAQDNSGNASPDKPKRVAQAWLNVAIKLSDGTVHKLPKGIPLHADNRYESALIEAMREEPDRLLDLQGTVVFTDGTVTQEPIVIKL